MEKIYDVQKSIEGQEKLCKEEGYPHFAPKSGVCWRCKRNIYEPVEHGIGESKYITGITVEKALTELITGCPHCNKSYCD